MRAVRFVAETTDRDKPAYSPVWKNAKDLRLVEWADKHLITHYRKSN
jgi:hypothetical protein